MVPLQNDDSGRVSEAAPLRRYIAIAFWKRVDVKWSIRLNYKVRLNLELPEGVALVNGNPPQRVTDVRHSKGH